MAMHVVFNVHFLPAFSSLKTALILSSQMIPPETSSQFKSTLGPETSFKLSHKLSAILGSHVHLRAWSTYFLGKWRNLTHWAQATKCQVGLALLFNDYNHFHFSGRENGAGRGLQGTPSVWGALNRMTRIPFVHNLQFPVLKNVAHLRLSWENCRHEFSLELLLLLRLESLVPFLQPYLSLTAEEEDVLNLWEECNLIQNDILSRYCPLSQLLTELTMTCLRLFLWWRHNPDLSMRARP